MQLRCICTSARWHSQMGRIVNKVMSVNQTKKSKRKQISQPIPAIPQISISTRGVQKPKTHNDRRVVVLNKIFMKHITDLMSTGEVASQLVGRGIEVTHVKVAPDFSIVNVYWISKNDADANKKTEEILKVSAGHLYHELSQLHVIGVVPPIAFVKNKKYTAVKDVEDRLAKIDFGEDFVPSAYISNNNISILETSLPPNLKTKIFELSKEISEEEPEEDLVIPEMRHNVLGFDHSIIMKKIKASLSKSKMAEENRIIQVPVETITKNQVTPEEVASFLSNKEEQQLFNDFLKKRRSQRDKRLKARPLRDVKLEEEEEWEERMKDIDYYSDYECDYADENENAESDQK